jgi:hypothetical protein
MATTTEEKTIDHILLEESVALRQQFIREVRGPRNEFPEDPKDRALILKAADGIEKIAMGRMRIKQEDKTNASNEKIAQLLAGVYKGVSSTNNPYVIPEMKTITPEMMGAIPSIPEHLQTVHLVDGETSINPRQLSYKEFTDGTPLPPSTEEE